MDTVEYATYKGICFSKCLDWKPTTYEVSISLAQYPNILRTIPKCAQVVEGDCLTLIAYSLTKIKELIKFISDYHEIPKQRNDLQGYPS